MYGCCRKLGVLFVGVLIVIRAYWAPDSCKLVCVYIYIYVWRLTSTNIILRYD